MAGIKELKTRIKSIGSTRKITRAMQMVSAAKMRKAKQAALNSRTYSSLAWELINNLTGGTGGVIPSVSEGSLSVNEVPNSSDSSSDALLGMTHLLKSFPNASKTGVIIISTNKGLVGGFNANLMNVARPLLGSEEVMAELLVMGRKAKDFALRFNKNLIADFPKSDTWVSINSIYPLAKMVSDLYQTGEYKNISIIYSQFVSTLVQKATIKQLLPFTDVLPNSQDKNLELENEVVDDNNEGGIFSKKVSEENNIMESEYLFEPSPEIVLNNLLPRIIESQIYQAVLESDASEHSARMVMMKNATEAAGDIIEDLTLTYNGLRQSKITTELSEITAGRIALE